ncbi:Ku protein [Streptomyces phaeochromogenes]|uniref:Ku protein n=1 Tax=Streptomyces phaeochromogenes TaxID=1923 RepID=UPI0040391BE8
MALERSAKVAIAKYAWSGRERLGLLRVRDDAIVLHAMRWPDEIRSPQELPPPPPPPPPRRSGDLGGRDRGSAGPHRPRSRWPYWPGLWCGSP